VEDVSKRGALIGRSPLQQAKISMNTSNGTLESHKSDSSLDLSIVVPVYHGASTLPALVTQLLAVLEPSGRTFEILLIDDGSKDGSWKVIHELQETHPDRLVAVQLMRNYGQHNALMAGFRLTRGQLIVTMDEDLQHPPEEVPRLIEAIESRQLDLVYGSYEKKKHAGWRNLGSALINGFYQLVFRMAVHPSAFRIVRRELLECIFSYSLNYTYIDGLFAWNSDRIGEIEVAHKERAGGRSGYSLAKLILLALNLFTNFSLLPLQIVSFCGIMASVGGIGLAFYYLFKSLLHDIAISGYASTIIIVLVLGGIQLLALGIMGEYIGRLHLNVNRKPQYSVRQVLGRSAHNDESRTASREMTAAPQADD
jgi:undecaprenyl-phosphate 4-deoxy-4-formamido-L-arabinose transferase